MIVFLLMWFLLLIAALGCGYGLVGVFGRADVAVRTEDRLFIALWLGVLVIGIGGEALSLVMPVGRGLGAIALGAATLAGLLRRELCRQVGAAIRLLPTCSLPMAALFALYAAQPVFWFDTGLYHAQIIRWLSEHGVVTGLGLLHGRLAFLSTWLVFPAVLEAGVFDGQLTALMGGFAVTVMAMHFLVAARAMIRGNPALQDGFAVLAFGMALPLIFGYGMAISPAPDLAIIALVIVVAWYVVAARTVPIEPAFVALAAMTVKSSALPLAVIASLGYLARCDTKRRLVALVLAGLFVLPHFFGIFRASGCFVYPVPLSCFEVPWGLGAERARIEADTVTMWARWNGAATGGVDGWSWIPHWWAFSPENKLFAVLLVVSMFALPWAWREGRHERVVRIVIALAVAGAAFVFFQAPVLRFGLGYLVLTPALAGAGVLVRSASPGGWGSAAWRVVCLLLVLVPIMLMFVYVNPFQKAYYAELDATVTGGWESRRFNWWVPERLAGIVFVRSPEYKYGVTAVMTARTVRRDTETVGYAQPDGASEGLCWNASLPCTPALETEIEYRDSARGLAGGFERAHIPR